MLHRQKDPYHEFDQENNDHKVYDKNQALSNIQELPEEGNYSTTGKSPVESIEFKNQVIKG
jgi:hypothetical protein